MHIISNTSSVYTLRRMALMAFTFIKQIRKLERLLRLGSNLWIASLAVTCARKIEASLPQAS